MRLPIDSLPRALLRLVAIAIIATGCGDSGPPPPRPTTISLFPAQTTFDAVGHTRTFIAGVKDQNGVTMEGQAVDWSSSDPGVVSVDATGTATARSNGAATVRAASGDAVQTASVTVAQVATTLVRTAGDGQAGPAGTPLGRPLEVQVRDRLGNAVANETIAFSVIGGGGSIVPESIQTDAQGRATATWTLGPRAGEAQSARAAVQGTGIAGVAFVATGVVGPAAELRGLAGTGQAGVVGTTLPLPLQVQLLDAFDNPIPSQITFTVTAGGGSVAPAVVTTGALGVASSIWTLGATAGAQTVRATAGGLSHEFEASAVAGAGPPASIAVFSGDAQAGPAGSALPKPLTVAVRDALGIGVAGVEVGFAPSEGGVAPAASLTNASGLAATTWTLGPTVGPQQVVVSAAALAPVTFTAEGVEPPPTCILEPVDPTGFDIQVCFVLPTDASVRTAFANAAARWESLVTGDLPALAPNDGAASCVTTQTAPPIQGAILDDLVIYAVIEEIDGPLKVLGSAGPCYIRNSNLLTSIGVMRFDIADTDRLAAMGQLEEVILHEMGHVLGLGTLWPVMGLLANPATVDQTTIPDTHFTGPLAIAAFDASGGQGRTVGEKVPVENAQGGGGSLNGHWRETVMDRELMTPFLDANVVNPLSIITVQSLADLGYVVSNAAADGYTVPHVNASLRGAPGPGDGQIALFDDIERLPLRIVDERGRVMEVLPVGGSRR